MPEIDYTLHNVFRWYDSTDKQSFRRFQSGDYSTYRLNTPYNRLLPFQIRRVTRPNLITVLDLYTPEDVRVSDLLALCPALTFEYKSVGTYDYLTYKASKDFTSNLPKGFYYCLLSDGKQNWYSEVFFVGCELIANLTTLSPTKPGGLNIVLNSAMDVVAFRKD
jgi:hypothetical protein